MILKYAYTRFSNYVGRVGIIGKKIKRPWSFQDWIFFSPNYRDTFLLFYPIIDDRKLNVTISRHC